MTGLMELLFSTIVDKNLSRILPHEKLLDIDNVKWTSPEDTPIKYQIFSKLFCSNAKIFDTVF